MGVHSLGVATHEPSAQRTGVVAGHDGGVQADGVETQTPFEHNV
jgi:hypothetical protein